MICSADIREWRNRDVVDPKQRRFGMLDAVHVDAATCEPAMATVRTGLPTRHRLVFVLLDDAVLGPGYVKVSYARGQVRKAPSIDTDDLPPAGQEEGIFRHYGMTYRPGANDERQLSRR